MAFSARFTGRDRAKIIVLDTSDEEYVQLDESLSIKKRNSDLAKQLDHDFYTREAILRRLTTRIFSTGSSNHITDGVCSIFESCKATHTSGITETQLRSFLSKTWSRYNSEFFESSEVSKTLVRLLKHLAYFPFDPSNGTDQFDFDGLYRAFWLFGNLTYLDGDRSTFGHYLQSVPIRSYRTTFPARESCPTDHRRMFFRALAVTMSHSSVSKEDIVEAKQIPVSYFLYFVTGGAPAAHLPFRQYLESVYYVLMQCKEKEHEIDLLDVARMLNPDAMLNPDNVKVTFKSDNAIKPLKLEQRPALTQHIESYKHELSELNMSTIDLQDLIKVLVLLKYNQKDTSVISMMREYLEMVPASDSLTWEEFDEFFAMHMPELMSPSGGRLMGLCFPDAFLANPAHQMLEVTEDDLDEP